MQTQEQTASAVQEEEARSDDRIRAWMNGQRVKYLRLKIEELDRACAQVRAIIYALRKELGQ